jgi:hypothetical protein
MKSITRFYDLHQYGIRPLTGEADLFGQRMLCDLTPQGAKLVAAWLGLSNAGLPCNPAWNAGGAVGSCLLPYKNFEWRTLALLALHSVGCTRIYEVDKRPERGAVESLGLFGFTAADTLADIDSWVLCLTQAGQEPVLLRRVEAPGDPTSAHAEHAASGRNA